eukprot:5153927-Prymnesium_polylepis.1
MEVSRIAATPPNPYASANKVRPLSAMQMPQPESSAVAERRSLRFLSAGSSSSSSPSSTSFPSSAGQSMMSTLATSLRPFFLRGRHSAFGDTRLMRRGVTWATGEPWTLRAAT